MKLIKLAKRIHYHMIREYFLILELEELEEEYIFGAIALVRDNQEMLSNSYTPNSIKNEEDFDLEFDNDRISLGEAVTNILYMTMKHIIKKQLKGVISTKMENAIRPLIKLINRDTLDNFDVKEKVRIMNLLS